MEIGAVEQTPRHVHNGSDSPKIVQSSIDGVIANITSDQVDALDGTGTPNSTNKYVTNDDVTEAKTASKIPRRDANSDILVATTPTAGDAATSKTYVDSNYLSIDKSIVLTASDNEKVISETTRGNDTDTYTKVKEIIVYECGEIRTKFDLKSSVNSYVAYGVIYINGVLVGTQQTNSTIYYVTKTEDFYISAGDRIQLYIHGVFGTSYAYVQDFSISYDRAEGDSYDIILN